MVSFDLPRRLRTSPKKVEGLCTSCSEIDFDQFASPLGTSQSPNESTTTILSLLKIMKNHDGKKNQDGKKNHNGKGCNFCSLLFEAIALPMHDPFEHPAIKDHMPDELRGKTFATWAKGLKWHDKIMKIPHPFGKSRNDIEFEINESDADAPITVVRREDLEAAKQAGVITSAAVAGAGFQAATQEKDGNAVLSKLGNAGSHFANALTTVMNKALPVAVTVRMHNKPSQDAGLLKIAVWGFGNEPQAPLSILSFFNVRVESNYQDDGLVDLRYGRIMGDMVQVETDCRRWLDHCRQRHGEDCERPDWSRKLSLPSGKHFRLVEIDEHEDDKLHVVKVGALDQGFVPEYAALSYVWGEAGKRALNLGSTNESELSAGIPAESVARTIADAAKVTRRLGLRYLWVDSLCVIQKSPKGDDEQARNSQLNQMGSIYGHASVVIIAADGEDAGVGLAGITSPRAPGQIAREVRPNVNVMFPIQYDTSYGKWDTRAWTLQEKLLSKRMLVFGANHVSFHCRHGILREDMPAVHAGNGPPRMPHLSMPENCNDSCVKENWDGSPVLLRSPFFDEYARLLEQYTSRDRTESTDILEAVQGLLKVLENMRSPHRAGSSSYGRGGEESESQDHTLYGLPEEFLDLALLWQPPAVAGTRLTRRTNDLKPSWSWAGWEVSKVPGNKTYQAQPGVRFEEPFWVSSYDDMSLRKIRATGREAEERFRPLVTWFKWVEDSKPPSPVPTQSGTPVPPRPSRPGKTPPPLRPKPIAFDSVPIAKLQFPKTPKPAGGLVPVNKHGLGIVCRSREAERSREVEKRVENRLLDEARRFRGSSTDLRPPSVRPDTPLDGRHLVCETQVGRFRLRQNESTGPRAEDLWEMTDAGDMTVANKLEIVEAEILDDHGNVVGYVIPTDPYQTISTNPYDFILLSESQYWGNEKRIDVAGFPLFNVMIVSWDERGEFARRVGLGKISKSAWSAANLTKRIVILV